MKYLFMALLLVGGSALADLVEDRATADAYLEAGKYKKAFQSYRSLGKDGDHHSQYKVSEMYAAGTGVKSDLMDAYAWSVLAAETGLEKAVDYSETLLARIEDKSKAAFEARKLMDKYGKEALQERAEKIAARENGRRSGSCTGSRLTCRGVSAYSAPYEGAGAPAVDPAGG